jgi:maltooligosyltrehalose trehalohydrolase
MGQEWAASTPFQFFTHHHEELGRLVTEGRRREFSRFSAFASPQHRERIPDPQDLRTFEASRLNWEERETEPHASMLRLTAALLTLRRQEPALRARERDTIQITALNDSALLMRRGAPAAQTVLVVCQLRGPGVVSLREASSAPPGAEDQWELLLTTEEKAFAPDPLPPRIERARPVIEFARPGVAVLRHGVASRKGV